MDDFLYAQLQDQVYKPWYISFLCGYKQGIDTDKPQS